MICAVLQPKWKIGLGHSKQPAESWCLVQVTKEQKEVKGDLLLWGY